MMRGITIITSSDWPQVRDGTTERRYPAHPLVVAIYRLLNRLLRTRLDPDIVVQVPRYRDADMLYDERAQTIYCSPRQLQELRRATAAAGQRQDPRHINPFGEYPA